MNKKIHQYRNNGAVGAILDEYQRALNDLEAVLSTVSTEHLVAIVDAQTKDPNCMSIQTILSHVVSAGYNYAIQVRRSSGETIDFMPKKTLDNIPDYITALKQMFAYNEQLFIDYPNLVLEEYDCEKKMLMRWGQRYDVDQLFEHAIMHILRHRRQIERFLITLNSD
ncbi:MAG: DinB family protein [Gilvibacter sp.]